MNPFCFSANTMESHPQAASAPAPRAAAGSNRGRPGPFAWRKFEAAQTDRLNEAHWQQADGATLNADLALDLETLRVRAAYEVANNGTVEGVIATHCEDIVGPEGPTLQVESDDDAFDDAAEAAWRNWFYAPCPNPKLSGVQMLKLWVRRLWDCGEFLAQLTTGRDERGPIRLRVKPIHPRRLRTPMGFTGDPLVCLGVRFSGDGVPTQYYIDDPTPFGNASLNVGNFTAVPPDLIIHEFLLKEEDQARGYPWLAGGMRAAADIRDADDQVLDAIRQAADAGLALYTESPQATYIEVNESAPIQRRQQWTIPPGWKPLQVKPEHPGTGYMEYRSERQSEIGRPVCMPLMTIRLDSSKSNYSSARFDGQNYHRACKGIQSWLSGTPNAYGCLSWLFWEVMKEARFTDTALRRRPQTVKLRWLWPVPPHVDPTKERAAERLGIENGTLPFAAACQANGYDEEAAFAMEERTNRRRADRGLPPLPPPGAYLRTQDAAAVDDPGGEQTTADEEDPADAIA